MCHIPGERHNLKTRDTVLVRGGRPNDLPGVYYKVIRGKESTHPVLHRRKARSKYGVKSLSRFLQIRDLKHRVRSV
jgi:small subunit ribosomal protein S12